MSADLAAAAEAHVAELSQVVEERDRIERLYKAAKGSAEASRKWASMQEARALAAETQLKELQAAVSAAGARASAFEARAFAFEARAFAAEAQLKELRASGAGSVVAMVAASAGSRKRVGENSAMATQETIPKMIEERQSEK